MSEHLLRIVNFAIANLLVWTVFALNVYAFVLYRRGSSMPVPKKIRRSLLGAGMLLNLPSIGILSVAEILAFIPQRVVFGVIAPGLFSTRAMMLAMSFTAAILSAMGIGTGKKQMVVSSSVSVLLWAVSFGFGF